MATGDIAAALGISRRSGRWWRCICPVHGSRTGRSLSLALREGDRGLIVHCHAGCDPRDVLSELRRRGLLPGAVGHRPRAIPTPSSGRDDKAGRIAAARRIWNTAQDAHRSPVACYLAGRGITTPPPRSLRWAPRCHHPSGIYLPAMVARVDDPDGKLIAVHRTFLRPDGSDKTTVDPQKAMLAPVACGAVRLGSAAETLIIGEGIEQLDGYSGLSRLPSPTYRDAVSCNSERQRRS